MIRGSLDQHDIVAVSRIQNIVARAPIERVIAGQARELVHAVVADEEIIEGVARAIDVGAAEKVQVLHVGTQREVRRRTLHEVDAGVENLNYRVGIVLHNIGVVARPTRQNVNAVVAGEDVGEGIAGAVEGRTREREVLNVRTQREARR